MNKRQRKKARRSQIRVYTSQGAIPGPYRNLRQAIRIARQHGHPFVFRYKFQWRTIRWSHRIVRTPAMWCVSIVRLTADGVARGPSEDALRNWSPWHYGKVV